MTPTSTASRRRPRQPRKPLSCEPCRRSKIRCDRQHPCGPCKRRKCVDWCVFGVFGDRPQPAPQLPAPSLPAPSLPDASLPDASLPDASLPDASLPHASLPNASLLSPPSPPPTLYPNTTYYPSTTAPSSIVLPSLPSSTVTSSVLHRNEDHLFHDHWDAVLNRPIAPMPHPTAPEEHILFPSANICFPFSFGPGVTVEDVLKLLPPDPYCEYLVTHYFMYLSPLFHILHDQTFQQQYNAYLCNPSQTNFSWLALLCTICSLAIYSLDDEDPALVTLSRTSAATKNPMGNISLRYRAAAMICLSRDNCLVNNRLSSLEALLLLIYNINHFEGLEHSWNLLGMALNMAVALQCNNSFDPAASRPALIENERRRRCWTGIVLLYTNQAISYKDTDMSFLYGASANPNAAFAMDAISSDAQEESVMTFKFRIFQLWSRICRHIFQGAPLEQLMLTELDGKIADEQRLWDSVLLSNGLPSVLNAANYAHWCILQLYAHQLYLRLHRPFCRSQFEHNKAGQLRDQSRVKCVTAGAALLDLHQQLCERPRLRRYRWVVYGMTSLYAFHGAVALASCMLENPDPKLDHASYRATFDAAVARIEQLQSRSPICVKSFPVLHHMQTLLRPKEFQWCNSAGLDFANVLDDWIGKVHWDNPESINWTFWDDIINPSPESPPPAVT